MKLDISGFVSFGDKIRFWELDYFMIFDQVRFRVIESHFSETFLSKVYNLLSNKVSAGVTLT